MMGLDGAPRTFDSDLYGTPGCGALVYVSQTTAVLIVAAAPSNLVDPIPVIHVIQMMICLCYRLSAEQYRRAYASYDIAVNDTRP